MVSTRGIKSKFTEGELVLCYEPDPAKTKVLYDSKVLEINVNKDENGKKFLEFLIHFQGWNPTWDRFVTEDYVLKDTAENRQLQKELAEKAQLTTAVKFCRGGNLYKRDRKKRRRKLSEKINESLEAKRPLLTAEAAAATPTRSHESSSESSSEEESVVLPIPDALKKLLELDYRLITQENKLVKLPVKYNVLCILESYVKECAIKEISNAQSENEKSSLRSSCANSAAQNPDKSIDNLCNKLNLCKEVVDGLRVYFDFTLKDLLLYQQERDQYNCVMSHFRQELINSDLCLPGAMNTTQTGTYSSLFQQEHHTMTIKQELDSSPPPSILSSNSNSVVSPSQYVVLSSPGPKDTLPTSIVTSATSPHATTTGSSGGGGDADRRKSLRSHRTSVSGGYELTNGSVPKSHPVVPNIKECASSATSVSSLDTSLPVNPPLAAGSTTSRPSVNSNNAPRQEALLSQIMSWKIIPQQVYRKGEQVLPSQVYGATHLTRLFVKLPELLQPSGMSDSKMEVLLQRLNAFLEYLESHKDDWFGESHYVDAENSISYNDGTLTN